MSHPQEDGAIGAVTTAQLNRIARDGVRASPTALDPTAVNLAEALVATLGGAARTSLLPPDLRQQADQVRQRATIGFPRIASDLDGVRLSAHTIRLDTTEPRPVVIVPAGWTPLGWALFEYTYLQLALRGYHVLAYTPRGIGTTVALPGGGYVDGPFTSEGTIDVAGPADWADGTTVIDYAQRYFEPSSIAFLGESYGSGISQLVAANDPAGRVGAVVALSTWGNLATSLYDNDTRHLAAVRGTDRFHRRPGRAEVRRGDAAAAGGLRRRTQPRGGGRLGHGAGAVLLRRRDQRARRPHVLLQHLARDALPRQPGRRALRAPDRAQTPEHVDR
ncbi:alpha/beta hydrolase family protein [Streptomyces sp. NPDC057939]|uniref:alpha/beta hydrolase family protein n=1 Tax=Streptomyces sp. NPDC057939 TaxID=3346284 RepID=UPI0036E0122E